MFLKLRRYFSLTLAFLLFCVATQAQRPIRVLAIDGGGIRGIIAATVLERMEHDLKPISELFDVVIGTSIGGIIALALTTPGKNGSVYSAAEVVKLALNNSDQIFASSLSHRVKTVGGLVGPKYKSKGIAKLMAEIFGDSTLSKARTPTFITGYAIVDETGIEFSSEEARLQPDKDCLVREVAMATAAAPTYFETVDVHYQWGTLKSVADGALYKNFPAMLGYTNAISLYPNRVIEVYSLGNGLTPAEAATAELKGRGLLQWAPLIFRHLSNGSFTADHTDLHKLLNTDKAERYFRLNVRLEKGHKSIDNLEQHNLDYLYAKGVEATQSETYRQMIEKLRETE